MPRLRLRRVPAALRSPYPLLAGLALALPPQLLHGALASAAGTVFEAAPFALLGLLFRNERARRLAGLASCGCGAFPGALALPAVALCWFSFGPVLALLRLGAAAGSALLLRTPRSAPHAERDVDPLAQLESIGCAALAAAVASEGLRAAGLAFSPNALTGGCLFGAGAAIGLLSPCAGAAVATAAGLRDRAGAAAAGLLATSGVFPTLLPRPAPRRASAGGRGAYALLGIACGALVMQGAGGFVHPRMLPAVGFAAACSLVLALRARASVRTAASPVLPLGLLAALVLGSPVPIEDIDATTLAGAFPGAHVRFAGTVRVAGGSRTALVRYAITCCRADATPVSLLLERPLGARAGSWVEAAGTIVRIRDGRFALRTETSRVMTPPADPFIYR